MDDDVFPRHSECRITPATPATSPPSTIVHWSSSSSTYSATHLHVRSYSRQRSSTPLPLAAPRVASANAGVLEASVLGRSFAPCVWRGTSTWVTHKVPSLAHHSEDFSNVGFSQWVSWKTETSTLNYSTNMIPCVSHLYMYLLE
jgi:hypothetical protein